MNNNLDEAGRWLAQAQSDLRAARQTVQGEFYDIACFLSQQSAEKALKAYLYAKGERPVLGHATYRLVQRCAEYDDSFFSAMMRIKEPNGTCSL